MTTVTLKLPPLGHIIRPALMALALVLVVLQFLFVEAYVAHEHTFYYWDHAMYHNLAWNAWMAFQNGMANGWAHFQNSMTQDYNDLFTLPSLISFSLFNVTRPVFILTNFAVFFLAYEASIAFVVRRMFGFGWPAALVASLFLCALVPPLWLPMLEGYPDAGAAAALVFAFGLSLKPFDKKRTALLVGFLLALSFLLRRHYAYPAMALLIAKGAFDFAIIYAERGNAFKKALRTYLINFCVCGAALLATLAVIAPKLILVVLSTDYASLYESYKTPASDYLSFTLARFGGLLLLVSMGGLFAAYRSIPKLRQAIKLLALFVALALFFWSAGPSQTGHHYMLHVMPLFCVVGTGCLFAVMWKSTNPALHKTGPVVVFALLAANGAWALWFSPESPKPNNRSPVGLFSAASPPVVRKDYDQLVSLATHLANSAKADDYVYAIGSSFVFNQDLLRAVYTDALQQFGPVDRMVFGPEIDSRDISPLHAFAQANVYVVPDRPQYHLAPEGQKTILAVTQPFTSGAKYLDLFRAEDTTYKLEDGVTLKVWRRKPWTPEALHAALSDIRRDAPVHHPDWIVLDHYRSILVNPPVNNQTDAMIQLLPPRTNLTLFFDVPLVAGDYMLRFGVEAQPSCQSIGFRLSARSPSGEKLMDKTIVPTTVPGLVGTAFSLSSGLISSAFLFLSIETIQEQAPCLMALHNMSVSRDNDETPITASKPQTKSNP